ncbi:MAG: hypothetical protein LIO58_02515, partial [Oscillospiraceae bacterium]|nr:hypothetical protein [Oscillospiraceae bacterium]
MVSLPNYSLYYKIYKILWGPDLQRVLPLPRVQRPAAGGVLPVARGPLRPAPHRAVAARGGPGRVGREA